MRHEARFRIAKLMLTAAALSLGAAHAAEPAGAPPLAPGKSTAGQMKKMSNAQRWKAAASNADRRAADLRRHGRAQGKGK